MTQDRHALALLLFLVSLTSVVVYDFLQQHSQDFTQCFPAAHFSEMAFLVVRRWCGWSGHVSFPEHLPLFPPCSEPRRCPPSLPGSVSLPKKGRVLSRLLLLSPLSLFCIVLLFLSAVCTQCSARPGKGPWLFPQLAPNFMFLLIPAAD